MKTMMTALLFVLSFSASAVSTVQYFSKAGKRPYTCSGNFGQSGLLQKIGFSDKELQKGIPCEVADYDGNGTPDIWFKKCDSNKLCPSTFVLMKKNEVLKTIYLELEEDIRPIYEGSGFQGPDLKALGCKMPSQGSLVKFADEKVKSHVIYALNQEASDFEKISECTKK